MTRSGILPALCLLPALFFAGPVAAQGANCSFWTSEEEADWTDVTLNQIQICITSGLDVNDEGSGRNPIVKAGRYSDLTVFKTLLHESTDINANGVQSATGHAMMSNLFNDSDQRLKLLVDADATFTQSQLNTMLAFASGGRSIKTFDMLVEMGADPLSRPFHKSVLHFAVSDDDMTAEFVEHLIDLDVPIEGRASRTGILGEDGLTALMITASKANYQTSKALIEAGANVNAASRLRVTPLHAAISAENADGVAKRLIIRALIASGADVDAALGLGDAPIHAALSLPNVEERTGIARLLIEAGANANAKDSESNTPLIMAVRDQNAELIDLLLDWNVNVNAHDAAGKTAWNYAGLAVDDEDIDPELVHAYWRIYDASF